MLIQPQGSVSTEVNKQSIARIFGIKTSEVEYVKVGVDVSDLQILYYPDSQQSFYANSSTGLISTWVYNTTSLTIITDTGSYILDEAYLISSEQLSANNGMLLVGNPNTIADLMNISPSKSDSIYVNGAFSAFDGGGARWVFDKSDNSTNVTNYPRLYIAPNTDSSGASGAWRLDIGAKINSICYGVGISTDPNVNKQILEQLVTWNAGRKTIILPDRTIICSYLVFKTNPNMEGSFGATASSGGGGGTTFLTRDSYSTEPFFKVTSSSDSSSNRVTGLNLKNISVVSYDFYSTSGFNTFSTRSNRVAFSLNYCGGQVVIDRLCAFGFKQGLYANELWDGTIDNCRFMYCSDSAGAGTTPAVFFGSAGTDNINNMQINHLHIEFSPYSLYLGFCEHVSFNALKVEAYRLANATNNVIRIDSNATKVNINDAMFVTQNATSTHYMYNTGQFITLQNCWFAGADSSDYPATGIKWYNGAAPTNSMCKLDNCHFNRCGPASGTTTTADPATYPVILGNYSEFSGTIRLSDTYSTSSGTVTNTNCGLIAVGALCTLTHVHLIVGSSTKTGGPVFYFKGDSSRVERITQTSGNSIYTMAAGSYNNSIGTFGSLYQSVSSSSIDVYAKQLSFITSATTITQLNGFVGQRVTLISNVTGSVLQYGASTIVTTTGANISMVAGKAYEFVMVSNTKAVQLV